MPHSARNTLVIALLLAGLALAVVAGVTFGKRQGLGMAIGGAAFVLVISASVLAKPRRDG